MGKSSEKEVLLEMTNVEKSPFQLNKKYKDGNDFELGKFSVMFYLILGYDKSGSSKKISSWLKKRRKALCCSCVQGSTN